MNNQKSRRHYRVLLLVVLLWTSPLFFSNLLVVHAGDLVELVDSYTQYEYGYDDIAELHPAVTSLYSAIYQSFYCPADFEEEYFMYQARVQLGVYLGNPTGTIYGHLYAHSGVYGSGGEPTGDPLDISDGLDVTTIPRDTYTWFTFNFSETYELEADTHYCIAFGFITSGNIDTNNRVRVRLDGAYSQYHDGNCGKFKSNQWDSTNTDMPFYVYAIDPPPTAGEQVGTSISSGAVIMVSMMTPIFVLYPIGVISGKIKFSKETLLGYLVVLFLMGVFGTIISAM